LFVADISGDTMAITHNTAVIVTETICF